MHNSGDLWVNENKMFLFSYFCWSLFPNVLQFTCFPFFKRLFFKRSKTLKKTQVLTSEKHSHEDTQRFRKSKSNTFPSGTWMGSVFIHRDVVGGMHMVGAQ